MSNVPPDYTKSHSFTTLATQPITSVGLPGSQLDAEFIAISTTTNQTIDRLNEIQQDDGALRSGVVTIGSLSPETAAAISTTGATISGQWAAGITYHPGDIVIYGADNFAYICATEHTASVNFESDFSAKVWAIMGFRPATNDLVVKTFTGNGSTLTFNLEINPVSENNTQVFVAGVYKSKSTYHIDGTNLVFETGQAPTGAVEVVIGVAAELINNVVTIPNNSVGTAAIINLAVTGAKIADLTITTGKLADQSVTAAKIENNTVGTTKIADLSITSDKIVAGAVTSAKIAAGAVLTANIADSAIETSKVAAGAITAPKLASGAAIANIDDASILPAKLSIGGPTWNSSGLLSSSSFATGTLSTAGLASLSSLSVSTTSSFTGAATFSSTITHGTAAIPVPTGTAPIYGIRAWVVFDMTRNAAGAVDSLLTNRYIIGSGNVTSVKKDATGDFTVTFDSSTPMPDLNYAYSGSALSPNSGGVALVSRLNGGSKTTTTIQMRVVNDGGTTLNAPEVSLMFLR